MARNSVLIKSTMYECTHFFFIISPKIVGWYLLMGLPPKNSNSLFTFPKIVGDWRKNIQIKSTSSAIPEHTSPNLNINA